MKKKDVKAIGGLYVGPPDGYGIWLCNYLVYKLRPAGLIDGMEVARLKVEVANQERMLQETTKAYHALAEAHRLAVAATTMEMKIDYTSRTQHVNEIYSLEDDICVLEEDRDFWKTEAIRRGYGND